MATVKDLEIILNKVDLVNFNQQALTFFKQAVTTIDQYVSANHFVNSRNYEKTLSDVKKLLAAYTKEGAGHAPTLHKQIQQLIKKLAAKIHKENKKIFIIHGRNINMRTHVEALLGKLKLDYCILGDQNNGGSFTVLEKFIREADDCRYAIALLSADDIGSLNKQKEPLKKRARQNVVFELGYFIGKIGRKDVIVLHEDDVEIEIPSDFHGIAYESFDENGLWKSKLVRGIKLSGIHIDPKLAEKV